ncbi:hypothetical protein Drose_11765 [Dactylosporangium roseum]|uniref:Cysteine dioxygenase type I n=1 Tax=Dactylosporangium roseum TaxID=47989 RepID=A0ABY5ZCY0_9ACTN|nr:hypothetical protein [Dactylosporangium roseum]UWZ38833.1 hypothetical protein Drose_11765 [Dactylosporangium roseum]
MGDVLPQDLLLDRAGVVEVLDRLLASARGGQWPAGAPYRHVNGFTKIVAAEHADRSRLTLHYWPASPGAAPDVSRPHDHRFPFISVLLGGRQHFVELEEAPGGDAWRRFTYRPYLGGRLAHVTHDGEARLAPVRTVDRRPLEGHYAVTSAVVHQAVTDRAAACATLVLRGPRERRRSRVYYRPGEPPPRGGLQLGRRLDRAEVVRQLSDVAAMLG